MTEQIVGGDWEHGDTVAATIDGGRWLACRCEAVVHEGQWFSHLAGHHREHVVWKASMDTDREPRDHGYATLTPAAAKSIERMKPKVRRSST